MYCPRCGAANAETIKFCRQCGLAMTQIVGFVTSGATGALAPPQAPQPAPIHLPETSEMLALRQKRTMTVLAMILLPVVFTIIGEEVFNAGDVLAAMFLLIPLGIVWATSRYKVALRRLQEEQTRQFYAMQQPAYPQPVQTPGPGFQSPAHSPQLPPPTNRFDLADSAHGSVIEDDTRKLPVKSQ